MSVRLPMALSLAVAVLLCAGCASTAPRAKFTKEITPDSRIASPDSVQVKVGAAAGVGILPGDEQRLAATIKSRIEAKKVVNPRAGDAKLYQVELQLSRYDKGNAFARAMLAGLGQIHLDGTVSVYQSPDHVLVGEFGVSKTFAWGGIYGASTSMEDVEGAFADGIADALTGQNSTAANKTTSSPARQ